MNGLPARVKRQGKFCERLMPMRGSATTSASDTGRGNKQRRALAQMLVS